jgi:hypothetical protein
VARRRSDDFRSRCMDMGVDGKVGRRLPASFTGERP